MPVSYLISSYNKCEYLREVLATAYSELEQTGGEIIVVDDGSKDGSWDAITHFARTDVRISAHRQKNNGIFHVTNRLFDLSKQPWLRFVDCDDPLIPGSTHALKHLAENLSADYVFGQMVPYGPGKSYDPQSMKPGYARCKFQVLEDPLLHAIVGYNHVPTAALVRRSALGAKLDLPEDLVSCQDLALALQVFLNGSAVNLMAPVCWQLVGVSNRLSSQEELTFHQTIQILKHFGAANFDREHKRVAANKAISRSLRWIRTHHSLSKGAAIYAYLYIEYIKNKMGLPVDWERTMTLAAAPFEQKVRPILQGRKLY